MPEPKARLAWLWVGAGFLFQALPASLRDDALPVALKNAGITDTRITRLTGTLGLLVAIKLLWAPIVVRLGCPRRVIGATEALIVGAMGLLTLAAPQSHEHSFVVFGLLTALSLLSAGHDVALDGYYVSSLEDGQRSRLSGLLTAASKIGSVLAGPGLIWIAGWSASTGNAAEHAWADALLAATTCAALAWLACSIGLGREPQGELPSSRPLTASVRELLLDPRFPAVLGLILLYRASEIHLTRVLPLFSVSPAGLGLDNQAYAVLRLVTGVGGLALGGILGSLVISRHGLGRSLVPLGIAMHLPILGIAWLATHPGQTLATVGALFLVEHVAYGAGVCALLLAMMRLAEGPDAPVRYATLSTFAIGAAYLPGLWAGALADRFGYANYFLLTLVLAPAGIWASFRARRALDAVTPSAGA